MHRRMLLALLVLLPNTWGLASCGPAPDTPPTLVPVAAMLEEPGPSVVPSAAPAETVRPAARSSPTRPRSPTRQAYHTLTPTRPALFAPSPTPQPSPTPGPSPLPTVTAPPPRLLPPTPATSPHWGAAGTMSLGWRFSSNGHLTDAGVLYHAGEPLFFITSLGCRVYALTATGEVLWQAKTVGPAYALAIVDEDPRFPSGALAVGDDAGHVTLFDSQGRRLWRFGLGSRVTALASGWQTGLLAGGWDERLTLLHTGEDSARVDWQVDVGGAVSGLTTLPNLALVATLSGKVRAFDPYGAEVWRFDAGAPITGLEAVEGVQNDLILVGLQDGRLLALDPAGDAVLRERLHWQHSFGSGGPVWHVADVVGGAVPEIVAGTGGTEPILSLLSTKGKVFWHVAMPSPVNAISSMDLDGDGRGEILAGLADGRIQALDGEGRLRGTVHAGLPVWGLEPAGDGEVLTLADVVAWQISASDGPGGGSWLPPPPLAPLPIDSLLPGTVQGPGPKDGENGAILVFLGDIAPGRSMEAQLIRYGPAYPWLGLGPLLYEADLAVGNLECTLAVQGQPLDKGYLIRAHPDQGQMLLAGSLDLVTVANNHALDFGQAALDETLVTLDELGIAAVGAGPSDDPSRAHRPALFTLNGVRVAVLAFAAARWDGSVDVPVTDHLAWARPEAVQADVQAAGEQADVVIVLLHAGTEYAVEPSADQVAVAHAAIGAGADLVVGHHPHVTQTVERYGQGLIVYSLGDAVFDIPRPAAMQGHLLRVHVTRQGLARAELWPFWIEDAIRPRLLDNGDGAPRFEVVYP